MSTYYDKMIPVTNLLNLSVSFNRTSAFPIDARSYFSNVEDAKKAAATAREVGSDESVYYYGMPIVVFEDSVASMYIIQGDGSLKHCVNALIPDDKSLEVINSNDDSVIQLKNFGKEYYAFHDKDTIVEGDNWSYPNDMPSNTDYDDGTYCFAHNGSEMAWCVLDNSIWTLASRNAHDTPWYELTTGWKAGLEPKVADLGDGNYVIAWYEPSGITVEGLSSAVETLTGNVSSLSSRVESLENEKLAPDEDTIKKTTDNVIFVNEIPTSKVKGLDNVINWHDGM